jgi:hypothetical protein
LTLAPSTSCSLASTLIFRSLLPKGVLSAWNYCTSLYEYNCRSSFLLLFSSPG